MPKPSFEDLQQAVQNHVNRLAAFLSDRDALSDLWSQKERDERDAIKRDLDDAHAKLAAARKMLRDGCHRDASKKDRRAAKKEKEAKRLAQRVMSRAAKHEAGHLVADFVFGIPVTHALVNPNGTGLTMGLDATWFNDPNNPVPLLDKAARVMVVSLAGPVAEFGLNQPLGDLAFNAASEARGDLEKFKVVLGSLIAELPPTGEGLVGLPQATFAKIVEVVRVHTAELLRLCEVSHSRATDELASRKKLQSEALTALLGNAPDILKARADWETEGRAGLIVLGIRAALEQR